MADFKKALLVILQYEGCYNNDINDRGGETYCGIARKVWPNWEGWKVIDEIKTELITKFGEISTLQLNAELAADTFLQEIIGGFYKANFWDRLKLDQCEDQDVAIELFDTAVNQGVRTAGKYLQRSLNLLNRDQRDWPDLKVDGRIGPYTLGVLLKCLNKGVMWKTGLLKCLNGEQYLRYRMIAIISSRQEKFMHGWLKRVHLPAE